MNRPLLHLCFAASGFAALVWQVVWVRQLGLAFGSTVHAVSIVTAVFLVGLGVGARIGGRWADRTARAARGYAVCEVGVAVWGLALVPVLTLLAASGSGGTTVDAHGWLVPSGGARVLQLGLSLLLLGPPTLLMGASLPLLARPAVGDRLDLAGWRLGLLAAANTGGAALGALATDLWMVPTLGVRGTSGLAAALGVLAGVGALAWRVPKVVNGAEAAAPPAPPLPATRVALAVGLAGFAAMGIEVVWFRFLGSALGPYRAVFSVLLGVVLTGWLTGSLVGGALSRRFAAVPLFAAAQASVALLTLLGMVLHDPRALLVRQLALPAADGMAGVLAQHALNVTTVAAVALPAAIGMGVGFPLANALTQRHADHVGRAVGRIWLATTLGNAGGALITGLWLLPALGMQGTALGLGALAVVAPLVLVRPSGGAVPTLALSGAGLLAVLAFSTLPGDTLLWGSFPHGRAREEGVLAVREGLNETIVVTGVVEGPARLWTNGHPMSSTSDRAQRYMRLMAHLPLLAQEAPRRVMVICFGVGNTLHAASLHPEVEALVLADSSADVLDQAPWFAHANGNVLADPRLRVHVDDGRHVLRTLPPGGFDLVTLEPPPIAHAGVAALYSREFYTLAKERLAEGGWLTQWLPAYQVSGPTALALVRAFVDVFPDAVLLVGDGRELLLAGVKGGVPTLDVARIEARLAANPAVAADLARIGITDVADLAAMFAAPGATLAAATAGVAPLTDDHPVSESSQVSHVLTTELPATLFAPGSWRAFAPGLAQDDTLAARMAANEASWTSETFRRYTNR
jgi:spermidine synthase